MVSLQAQNHETHGMRDFLKRKRGRGKNPNTYSQNQWETVILSRGMVSFNYFPGGHFLPLSAYPQLCAGDGKNALE